jgi:hypothetical protein
MKPLAGPLIVTAAVVLFGTNAGPHAAARHSTAPVRLSSATSAALSPPGVQMRGLAFAVLLVVREGQSAGARPDAYRDHRQRSSHGFPSAWNKGGPAAR